MMKNKERNTEEFSEIKSTDRTGSEIKQSGIWRRFFHTCKVAEIPYGTLLLYFAAGIVQYTILIKVPQVSADFFNGDASVESIAAFLSVEIISMLVVQFVLYMNHLFRARTDRNLRNVLWRKILHLKPKYYDRVSASTLLSRITTDTESLNEFIMDVILESFYSIYSLVFTIVEMSGISLKASFALLVFVPVSLLISFGIGRLNLKVENMMKFRMSDLTDYLSELMASLPVVKAFNRQEYESRRGEKVIDDYYGAQRNVIGLDVARQIIGTVFSICPDVMLIFIGIRLLKDSTLTPAGWYVFYLYSGTLLGFVGGLGSMWEKTKAVQGKLNVVSKVLDEEEEGLEYYINEIVESGDIIFDNVSFGYDEKKVLDKVSFTIPKNKTTALIGYSGSGKSTVLKLIERIYDPDEGRILLQGEELKECDIRKWRDRIELVSQNAPMISGTIRENILYGIKREVTDEEIMQAAKLAYVDQFIEKCPDGLEHQVGQFGSRLSGGQKQKLSIARAILAHPEYLILDEPTASLDVISANEVAGTVDKLKGTMTIIIITHQGRMVRNADHVIVLDKGCAAAEGNGSELMYLNEFYTKMMCGETEAAG